MKKLDQPLILQLLNQVACGDIKAATQLFSLFQGSVYAFIRLQVPNDEAAEEILNDTFMIALSKPAQFDGTSAFTTWLCGIAKNLCRNWRRKTAGERETFSKVDLDDLSEDFLEDPNPSVLANIEQIELNRILLACIDKLPDTQREAMYWVFLEDKPVEDVAVLLNCPAGTVKSRLYYARAKIANCVRTAFGVEVAHA